MKKGEIWSIELPYSSGNEQMGLRHSVIIAEVDANIVVVIPFTSNINALRYPNTILISPDEKNNLTNESILLVFQLRAIDKKRIIKKVGVLDDENISKIDKMIINMLKLKIS